jgi:hypothetical protein
MLKATREAFGSLRQIAGTKNALAIVVLFLVAAPFIVLIVTLGYLLQPLEWTCSWAIRTIRGVGKRLDDPLFGPVTYQGSSTWRVERELSALGGRIAIDVPGSRSKGPSSSHHDPLQGLVERQHEIGRQVSETIFREYQAAAPALRQEYVVGNDWLSESFRESLPVLEKPDQIWPLLSNGVIALDDEPGSFSITWYCAWESAYGDLTKSFVNWKLEEDDDA